MEEFKKSLDKLISMHTDLSRGYELVEEIETLRDDAKGYLDDFIKEDETFNDLEEYNDFVNNLTAEAFMRIYDLAIYEITDRLLTEYNRKENE